MLLSLFLLFLIEQYIRPDGLDDILAHPRLTQAIGSHDAGDGIIATSGVFSYRSSASGAMRAACSVIKITGIVLAELKQGSRHLVRRHGGDGDKANGLEGQDGVLFPYHTDAQLILTYASRSLSLICSGSKPLSLPANISLTAAVSRSRASRWPNSTSMEKGSLR